MPSFVIFSVLEKLPHLIWTVGLCSLYKDYDEYVIYLFIYNKYVIYFLKSPGVAELYLLFTGTDCPLHTWDLEEGGFGYKRCIWPTVVWIGGNYSVGWNQTQMPHFLISMIVDLSATVWGKIHLWFGFSNRDLWKVFLKNRKNDMSSVCTLLKLYKVVLRTL